MDLTMKLLFIALLLITLSACNSTAPTTTAAASADITIDRDEFNGRTWLQTPMYLSRQGFTDTFPVELSLRARYVDDKREFMQLYVKNTNMEWGFYHSATGQNGHNFEFKMIDREVFNQVGIVTTVETFGLIVPMDQLKEMSAENWKIKVYGKRYQGVFTVPNAITKAFIAKVECFDLGAC
jgi:hypothetical protein